MSIKRKFFVSSVIMMVVPILLLILASVLALIVLMSYIPSISVEINDMAPILNKSIFVRYAAGLIVFFIATIVCCSLIVTSYISKSVIKAIRQISEAMDKLTAGELNYEFTCSEDAELKELYDSLEKLRLRLKSTVNAGLERERNQSLTLANISHDLKTPITSIKGYVEGIKDGIANTPEKLDRYLNTILMKANSLESMVENLNMYSKLNMNDIPYSMKRYDMSGFIKEVAAEFEIDISDAGMALSFDGILKDPENEPVYAVFDHVRMRRVFSNIISNSIKYRRSGIDGRIEISLERDDGGVIVSVSDNGIGISDEDSKKVFETFYRADPSRNLNIPGNGLGLAIAKKIVTDHGGKIWLRSGKNAKSAAEGVGTSIYIKLPSVG